MKAIVKLKLANSLPVIIININVLLGASYVLLSNCTQSITRERSIINYARYAHHESGSLLVWFWCHKE